MLIKKDDDMEIKLMKCVTLAGPFLMVLATVLGVQGCSSTPKTWQEIQSQRQQEQTENAEVVADKLPSWYLNKTPDNDEFIYVVASASAKNLHLAEEKVAGRLHAAVAKKLDVKSDVSTTEVSSITDGFSSQESTSLQTVNRTYALAQITAYESVEKKVVYEKGRFVVFEMARFPIAKWRLKQQQKQTPESSLETPAGFDKAVEKLDKLKAQQ